MASLEYGYEHGVFSNTQNHLNATYLPCLFCLSDLSIATSALLDIPLVSSSNSSTTRISPKRVFQKFHRSRLNPLFHFHNSLPSPQLVL